MKYLCLALLVDGIGDVLGYRFSILRGEKATEMNRTALRCFSLV